jgi:pyroglutamyl-peptidase
MKKILMTGFEPFLKESINPSKELVLAFGKTCDTLVLLVSYDRAWQVLRDRLLDRHYDFILMLGQAGERKAISLERVAINLQDTETADEDGVRRVQEKISETGPDAFLNPLPLRPWSQALQKMRLPVEISFTAGAFVCNSTYYQTFRFLKERSLQTQILFVHVPYLPEQLSGKNPGTPSMPFEVMQQTVSGLLELIGIGS